MEQERKKAQKEARVIMFQHRFELILIAMTAMLLVALFVSKAAGRVVPLDSIRLVLAIPALRMFSQFKRLRIHSYNLIKNWNNLWPILILLLLIFIEYGIVGVVLFSGKVKPLADAGIAPVGPSCDNFGLCLLLLFQCFTGQNWQTLLYTGIDAFGWSAACFTVSFVVLTEMLIGQGLLTAFFIDAAQGEDKDD